MSSDCIATNYGTGTETTAVANSNSALNNKKQKMSAAFDSLLFADDLILIEGILPFVGVGQYAFVAAVNKKMNQLYKEYCEIELKKNPRMVTDNPYGWPSRHAAESTDTVLSETFCNLLCAEYWLKDNSSNKKPDRNHVCAAIAKIGNHTVMKWARQEGFPWNERTCAAAAGNGNLKMLQWLREHGCPWDESACADAALNGHLGVLQWLRENGCPWSALTCATAAEGGHLEILKWARENGCSLNAWTCLRAAKNGHLEILQWSRENGCPWSEWTCAGAAENGHLEIISGLRKWLSME
ncbi:ankyrin repeat protein [Seminavis robusta]|uniref:Ankyrin repeat protein n=1 Tax=Seminavis robusta TaxID=568900 RepID=A0A9N8HDF0_9STRA|nr:ankyrin repeat protein [Seminavis robusta]|eukprot:Sro257_g100800.1 ankyrin repeat protein (297) ;mRNA; f:10336-11226